MKHLNFILAGLFFLCGLCCRAQVLPLEENVVLNTKEGQIKGKLLLPGGVKTCPVVLIIAGSGDRKSTRLNSSHSGQSRMPSSA